VRSCERFSRNVYKKSVNADTDIFGDKTPKITGKKHFTVSGEDAVGQIMEHPLSHYTTTYESDDHPSTRHDHLNKNEKQKCARRQVMETEYSRTICRSAERHRSGSRQESQNRPSIPIEESQYAEAYGHLKPAATKVNLCPAALTIPSFQQYAKKVTDIELMEQELMQKQLLLA